MKVYDCFIFSHELELLEIRLKTLNKVVDYFVIVEGNYTSCSQPKDFNFEKVQNNFASYKDKIIYVQVTDMPVQPGIINSYKMDQFLRDCILRGLANCRRNDLVMMSNVDEIPDPAVVKAARERKLKADYSFPELQGWRKALMRCKWFFLLKVLSAGNVTRFFPVCCNMDAYYYYLNYRSRAKFNATLITRYKHFRSPHKLREKRNSYPRVFNAGWQFSKLGDIEKLIGEDQGQSIYSKAKEYSKNFILFCLRKGRNMYGYTGPEYTYDFIPLDEIGIENVSEYDERYPYLFTKMEPIK